MMGGDVIFFAKDAWWHHLIDCMWLSTLKIVTRLLVWRSPVLPIDFFPFIPTYDAYILSADKVNFRVILAL